MCTCFWSSCKTAKNMKLGVSEAVKWGDRLVSGAPSPSTDPWEKEVGWWLARRGAEDITTITEKDNFFCLILLWRGLVLSPDGHWKVGNLLKWIRKSGNVMGNLVNWILRKSYCAVFGGADGWRSNTFDGELENILLGTRQNNLKCKRLSQHKTIFCRN